jgi:glycosyltransferase involved in cell wall biosynthesis
MAAGCAVIASRIGQVDGLIEHEVSGLLCSPGDPLELAGALWRVRCEPALRDRLGQAARAKVRRAHTWDATVRSILQLAGMTPDDRLVPAIGAAS